VTDRQANDAIRRWLSARQPKGWSDRPPKVVLDNDEILVLVQLGGPPEEIELFRQHSRDERIAIARSAEAAFGRKVSWGATAGGVAKTFTTTSIPVMTRLRMSERRVLDTLIDAGIARSRSEALAWCVRLVGDNESEWIRQLQAAFEEVESIRSKGPACRRKAGADEAGAGGDAGEVRRRRARGPLESEG
jgi:hypothetical protein